MNTVTPINTPVESHATKCEAPFSDLDQKTASVSGGTRHQLAESSNGQDGTSQGLDSLKHSYAHGQQWCQDVLAQRSPVAFHRSNLIAYGEAQQVKPTWLSWVKDVGESADFEEELELCKRLRASDEFDDDVGEYLVVSQIVHETKRRLAAELDEDFLQQVKPLLDAGKLDPHVDLQTLPSVRQRMGDRRFIENRIAETLAEYGEAEQADNLRRDAGSFWFHTYLGWLPLLALRDP